MEKRLLKIWLQSFCGDVSNFEMGSTRDSCQCCQSQPEQAMPLVDQSAAAGVLAQNAKTFPGFAQTFDSPNKIGEALEACDVMRLGAG
jgi:hypothetical protein